MLLSSGISAFSAFSAFLLITIVRNAWSLRRKQEQSVMAFCPPGQHQRHIMLCVWRHPQTTQNTAGRHTNRQTDKQAWSLQYMVQPPFCVQLKIVIAITFSGGKRHSRLLAGLCCGNVHFYSNHVTSNMSVCRTVSAVVEPPPSSYCTPLSPGNSPLCCHCSHSS